MVTEAIEGAARDLPTLRDPDRLIYFKEEVGGLVMGGYEPNPIPWALDGIPEGFHFTLLESNWDHFEPLMRSEEHTSELQSLMRISYAVFCLKKKTKTKQVTTTTHILINY